MIKDIGAFAGLAAFFGLAVLALLSFTQGRDLRRLREWAGSAPERDSDRKETTSAAASERAEEIRRLEEAREAERRAADLRETRRQRREAGLPEMTRSERLRESLSGGEGSRLGEPIYLVGIFVVVLVVAGVGAYAILHGFGGGGGGGDAHAQGVKPGQVEVAVLNGTAVEGLAGSFGDRVESHGFQLGAVTNSDSSFESSVVMFKPRNGSAAHRVASALGISRVRPMTEEIAVVAAGAPVAVVIGEDDASSAG